MPAKHGADTTDIRGSEAKYIKGKSAILKGCVIFLMTAFRKVLPKLSQPFTKAKGLARRFDERLKIEAFVFALLLIIFKNYY